MQSQSIIVDQQSKNSITHEESAFSSPGESSAFSSPRESSAFSSPRESSESIVSVNEFFDSKIKTCVKSISTSSKNKGIEKVEENKKKVDNLTKGVDINNSVVEMSSLIEPPRDEDRKTQYHLMSLNTSIYEKGDNPYTVRRQKNSSYCNELCPCPVDGCKFGGFVKWLGDEKRLIILQRMFKIYRKYKIDRSNTI